MAGNGPGKQAVLKFLFARLAFGHHLQIVQTDRAIIAALHQQTAGNRLDRKAAATRIGEITGYQQAQILLFGEGGAGFVRYGRSNHHLGENLANCFCGCTVKLGIDRDNPTKGRHAVAGERFLPCFEQAGALGNAARVGVFDNHD